MTVSGCAAGPPAGAAELENPKENARNAINHSVTFIDPTPQCKFTGSLSGPSVDYAAHDRLSPFFCKAISGAFVPRDSVPAAHCSVHCSAVGKGVESGRLLRSLV